MNTDLGLGYGLRGPHIEDILISKPQNIKWFEVISENYMKQSCGLLPYRRIDQLLKIRENYQIHLHGVSMNLGADEPIDTNYLTRLKELIEIFQPNVVSDHLCFTGINGHHYHDLFPLPYTKEAIQKVSDKILAVQDSLKRVLVIENVSSYVTYPESEMSEWDFLNEVLSRTGCFLLLDVNNVFVSSFNHRFDPKKYLNSVPSDKIAQIHIAGHEQEENLIIDTHSQSVRDEVWSLYSELIKKIGSRSSMIERDENIPSFSEAQTEIEKMEKILLGLKSGKNYKNSDKQGSYVSSR